MIPNVINNPSPRKYKTKLLGVVIIAGSVGLSVSTTANGYSTIISDLTTTSGLPGQISPLFKETSISTSSAVMEVRRLSGLTWDELADLFGVSRRSVHHWANGKPVNADNDQSIRRVLAVLRQISHGEAARTREALLSPGTDGRMIFDLLKEGLFERALERGGSRFQTMRPNMTPIAQSETKARRPSSPMDLMGALQDRPLVPGQGGAVKFTRPPPKKA